MKKHDKKTEDAIVRALNDVCETMKIESTGFTWLTHFVNYSSFPQSLKLVFVFDTNQSLEDAKNKALFQKIFKLTESHLKRESVHIKRIDKTVFFDTEENGADFNDVGWCRKYL